MRWPWVSRKRFEQENKRYARTLGSEQYRYESLKVSLDKEHADLALLISNYQALYVGFNPDTHDLQLLYTVDSLVLRGIPANDPQFFTLVAREMTKEIEMGLRSMHFGEVKDLKTNIRSREYLRDATKFERDPPMVR